MKYVSYFVWLVLGLALVILAVANRQAVILNLVPEGMQELMPFAYQVSVPLFLVIFLGVLIGLVIGFIWEFIREYRQRAAAQTSAREVKRLRREVKRLKEELGEDQDEILTLLE